MTSQRKRGRLTRRWKQIGLVAGLVAWPGLAGAQALDLFYERTVMTAADARCGLFEAKITVALAAAQAQARGAAMRAGADKAALALVESRALRKVAAAGCDSPDIDTAARRVREAYAGYAQMTRMTYPGDVSEWRADRGSGRAARWRLQQSVDFGQDRMLFGLAGREGANALLAVVQFDDQRRPYGARLVLRDVDLSRGPYLDTLGRYSKHLPLARRLPPPAAQDSYSAEARSRAGTDLAPEEMTSAWAFRFPAEAATALAGLDPREAVAVDFLFDDGGREDVRRAYVEVGDFAAGRAFLRVVSN